MAVRPSSPADNEPTPTGRRSRVDLLTVVAAALLVLAVGLIASHASDALRPPRAAPVPVSTPSAGISASTPSAGVSASPPPAAGKPAEKALPRSRPVRLLIPKISVDAPFTDLAVGPTGQLEPPPAADVNLVGWHAKGASPGEAGTSIIAGHVDTVTSPAVFAGLGALKKGDVFHVERADKRKASFVVDGVETFDKDHFPSERVYGDTAQAQVRLITCAGEYDRAAKDYTDNLVVFAHLT